METDKLTQEYINKCYWLVVKTRLDIKEILENIQN